MKSRTVYALTEKTAASGSSSIQLDIYDVIGDFWSGGDGNTTARIVSEQLKSNRSASEIHVRINSYGGILDEAHAIRAALIAHPAYVRIDIDGVAASAATVIMAAGTKGKVCIGKPCAVMIHEARSGARNATEADYLARASELRIANDGLAETYAAMSAARGKNVTASQFREMMAKESWFSAADALEVGLVDELTEATPDALVAKVDLSECANVPGWVAARFASPCAVSAPGASSTRSAPENAGNDIRIAADCVRANSLRLRKLSTAGL